MPLFLYTTRKIMARLSLSLEEKTAELLAKNIPIGVRSAVIDELICMISNEIEKNGPGVIGLILAGSCQIEVSLKE
jgi:hypothetical protein